MPSAFPAPIYNTLPLPEAAPAPSFPPPVSAGAPRSSPCPPRLPEFRQDLAGLGILRLVSQHIADDIVCLDTLPAYLQKKKPADFNVPEEKYDIAISRSLPIDKSNTSRYTLSMKSEIGGTLVEWDENKNQLNIRKHEYARLISARMATPYERKIYYGEE